MDAQSYICVAEIYNTLSFEPSKKVSTFLNFDTSNHFTAITELIDFRGKDVDLIKNAKLESIIIEKDSAKDLYTLSLKKGKEHIPQINEKFLLNCIYASIGINTQLDCYQLNIHSPLKEVIHSFNLQNKVGRNNFSFPQNMDNKLK